MNTNWFPRAGTVVLETIYMSSPETLGDSRVGVCACSVSLTKSTRYEEDEEDISFMRIHRAGVAQPLDSALSQCKLRIDR